MSLLTHVTSGVNSKEAWDTKAGIVLVQSAISFVELYAFLSYQKTIDQIKNEVIREIIIDLSLLYGIQKSIDRPNSLYRGGYLSGEQITLLKQSKYLLLEKIRPSSIGLVDAFFNLDNNLFTAIG